MVSTRRVFRALVLADESLVTTLSLRLVVKVLLQRLHLLLLQVRLLLRPLAECHHASSPAHVMKLLHSPRFARQLVFTR